MHIPAHTLHICVHINKTIGLVREPPFNYWEGGWSFSSFLGQYYGVLPQEPGCIEYYNQLFCLCGHLGGVSEIQTSLDISVL